MAMTSREESRKRQEDLDRRKAELQQLEASFAQLAEPRRRRVPSRLSRKKLLAGSPICQYS